MSVVAEILERDREVIIEAFLGRAAKLAPAGTSRVEMKDHLPAFLDRLGRAVRDARDDPYHAPPAENASEHGEQRERVGYSLAGLSREYAVLADCVYERLETLPASPPLAELRRLAKHFASAVASAVETYTAAHERQTDDHRRRLLEVFEQSPGFVAYLRGPEYVFELANVSYYQVVGHRELIGKPFRDALPEVVEQGFVDLLDQVYRTREPFVGKGMPVRLQRDPTGPFEQAYVDFIFQPIAGENGAVVGVLVQGSDVTEAKRAEQAKARTERALRASEDRFQSLFSSIDDAYCLLEVVFEGERGVDYRYLEANAAFASHTGLVDFIGKTIRELVPDIEPEWAERYARVVRTGEPLQCEDRVAGMDRWFEVKAHRVGPADLRHVAVVFKDITAKKKFDEEREKVLALESAARKAAEESNVLKDEFLATVSHELRTPLSAILGWTQLLRGGNLDATKAARALATIERNARAQSQLIEDILDVSRILAGKLRLELGVVPVETFIDAAVETVRPMADRKRIQVECAVDAGMTVRADVSRLQQVVWNLLSNAVKFTPEGGTIRVEAARGEHRLEITVTDSGQGIPADFLPFVFDRFRQAQQGSARSHGGLGLGLAIAKQLTLMHGGEVVAKSDGPGRGASFLVRLPLAASAADQLSRTPAPALPRSGQLEGASALVVDDDDDAREVLATFLQLAGAKVTLATSAAEARARLENGGVNVILSDLGMPDEDGYELIAKLRRAPDASSRIPAIAVTAFARPEDRSKALHAGFDSYIAKPVNPTELVAVVSAVLDQRREPG